MKSVPYFEILKQAFLITWKNKFLWFFGFLVSLGSFPSNVNWTPSEEEISLGSDISSNFIKSHPGIILVIFLVIVVVAIILLILRLVGTACLIKASNNISVYRQSTIRSIISEAKNYIGRLFLMGLLIGMALVFIMMIMAVPSIYMFSVGEKILGILLLLVALIIFIPIAIIAAFIKRYGSFYVVLGNMKTIESLESAYSIFKKNIKESLIMWCISIALNMVTIISILITISTVVLLFAPFGFLANYAFAKTGLFAVVVLGGFILLIASFIIFSWYSSFDQTMWVLFFQQIVLEKKEEKDVLEKFEAKVEIQSPEVV